MGFKIVVVDRTPSALKAAELALPAPEFEVAAFGDGLEALRAIPDIAPDAVLAGLSLPSRDGYEIADFVKSQPHGRQTAVVFLRGPFEPLDAAKIAPIDHDGIVVKPLFFPPCTVFASEIQGVDTDRIWGREYLVVRHQGTGCPTPLAIPVGGQSAMAAVVRAIAGALPESAPAEEKPTRRRWLAAGFSMSVRGTGYLDAYPRGVVVLLGLAGLALAAFFVVDGITSLIPETGFFGLIWTGLAALFLLSGLRELVRYLSRW